MIPDEELVKLEDVLNPSGLETFNHTNGLVILLVNEEDLNVRWSLLEKVYDDKYTLIANGFGPSGNLRECRHTYFYPKTQGYGFYVDFKVLAWAGDMLSKWFDY